MFCGSRTFIPKLLARIELAVSPLPRACSTTKPQKHEAFKKIGIILNQDELKLGDKYLPPQVRMTSVGLEPTILSLEG
jgi:hypothetical protein